MLALVKHLAELNDIHEPGTNVKVELNDMHKPGSDRYD